MFEGLVQPGHLVLILLMTLIVLGPGKAGDLGRDLGRGVREFRRALEPPKDDSATR